MQRSNKSAWLEGPGDLQEADVADVPVKGQSIRVRGLAAAYSNQASSEALEWKTWPNGQQTATVNTARLEVLQFAHGCVDPAFSADEAKAISEKFGPAFKKVVSKIDELSGVDKEAIQEANARFQGVDENQNGASGGNDDGVAAGGGGSDVHLRAGVGDGDAG